MPSTWRKSPHSFSNGNCVQVASLPGGAVGVRDSTQPAGPVLVIGPCAWTAFIQRLKVGQSPR